MITLWKKNRLAVLPTNDRFTKRSFETVTPFPLHHTSQCGISIVMGAHNNRVLDTGLRSNDNSASLLSCTSTFNRAVLISDIILVCFVAFTFNTYMSWPPDRAKATSTPLTQNLKPPSTYTNRIHPNASNPPAIIFHKAMKRNHVIVLILLLLFLLIVVGLYAFWRTPRLSISRETPSAP